MKRGESVSLVTKRPRQPQLELVEESIDVEEEDL
jgi:hypothetical protein